MTASIHIKHTLYLEELGEQPLEDLVPPIAEEAVCVHFVSLAIQLQYHLVSGVFNRVPGFKGDLCGSTPEVHGPQGLLLRLDPFSKPSTLSQGEQEQA